MSERLKLLSGGQGFSFFSHSLIFQHKAHIGMVFEHTQKKDAVKSKGHKRHTECDKNRA